MKQKKFKKFKPLGLILSLFLGLGNGYHMEGGSCYNYFTQISLVGNTGTNTVAPIDPKSDAALCTTRSEWFLYASDCSSPFVNSHPSIVINQAADFSTTGNLLIDTTNPVEKHAYVTGCVKVTYHGYNGDSYSPTSYTNVFKLRICGEHITMSTSKAYYQELAYEYNSGTKTDTTLDTSGFSDIYESVFCGLLAYEIYTYDTATSSFVAYVGTDVYWDANDLDIHYRTTTKGTQTYYVQAVTHGGLMQDYERIKVTICGLETLTASSGVYTATFPYVAVYANAAIEWSVISTWLTFDANTQSDATCRSLSPTYIKLYRNSAMSSLWSSTSLIQLEESPADQFRIKVFNNNLAQWTSIQTLYYGETTLGGVTAYKQVNVQVCGQETLTASAGDYDVIFQAASVYANKAIEWTIISTFFTFATAGPPTCRPNPNTIQIFTDTTFSTEYSDTSQIQLVSEVAGEYRIKVYNNVAFPGVLTVYMREITLGLITAYKKIMIRVCGFETLKSSPKVYSVSYDRVSVYANEGISWSTLSGFFTYSSGTKSSAACRSQDLSHIQLFTDTTFTTQWSDTSKIQIVEDPSNEFRIKVYNNVAWTQMYTVYLREITLGMVSAYVQLNIEVCGHEKVTLVNAADSISKWYEYRSGSGAQYINRDDIINKFQSSSQLCTVQSYEIYTLNKGVYSLYTNRDVGFTKSYRMKVQTWYEMNQTVYVKALTKYASSTQYLPITLVVEKVEQHANHQPSFFEGGVEFQSYNLDFNTQAIQKLYRTGEYIFIYLPLPTILDWQQDFCSLLYDSKTLGSGYWTNNTDKAAVQDLDQIYWKTKGKFVTDSFLSYDIKENQIKISIKKTAKLNYVGSHSISFLLFDVNSGKSTGGSGSLNISIVEEYVKNIETYKKKKVNAEVEDVICTAKIVKVTNKGLVYIDFNKKMATNFNLTWINQTTVDMYIEPYNDWHLDQEKYAEPQINITSWHVKSFIENRLLIQLKFHSPPHISPKYEPDKVVFHAMDRTLFLAIDENAHLHPYYTTLKGEIKSQLREGDFNLSSSALSGFMTATIFASLGLSILFAGLFALIVGLVNAQQLIVHLPIMAICFPANAMAFIRNLMKIVMMDFMELFQAKKDEGDISDEVLNIPIQTQELSYDSHHPKVILGSLGLMIILWFVKIGVFAIYRIYVVWWGKGLKYHDQLQNTIFFKEIILICIEGYLTFLISYFLKLQQPEIAHENGRNLKEMEKEEEEYSQTGESFVAWSLFLTCLVVLPGVFVWMLKKKSIEEIKDPKFEKRWGQLCFNIQTKDKFQIAFYLVFIVRRFIYVSISYIFSHRSQYQIICLNFLNLFVGIYQGYFTPICTRKSNRIELMNECWIAAATYNLMLFTEWVADEEVRYFYGWSFIVIMCMQGISNLVIIWHELYNIARMYYIKYYRIYKPKFDLWWAWKKAQIRAWWERIKWRFFDWCWIRIPKEIEWIRVNWPRFFGWFSSYREWNPVVVVKEPEPVPDPEPEPVIEDEDSGVTEYQYEYYSEDDENTSAANSNGDFQTTGGKSTKGGFYGEDDLQRDLQDLMGGKSKVQPGYMGQTNVSKIKHHGGRGADLDYKEEQTVKKKGKPIYITNVKPNYMANTETRKIHYDIKEDPKKTIKKLVQNAKSVKPLDMSIIKEEQIQSGRDSLQEDFDNIGKDQILGIFDKQQYQRPMNYPVRAKEFDGFTKEQDIAQKLKMQKDNYMILTKTIHAAKKDVIKL